MCPPFSMRTKHVLSAVLMVLFLSLPSSIFAEGNSTSMGFLSTVVSDGAFDAVRNPALLGLQTSQYAVGVMVSSGPPSTMDVDVFAEGMSFQSAEEFALKTGAAFTWKAGNSVLGLALTTISDEEFYKNSEAHLSMRAFNQDVNAEIEAKMFQKEKKYAPALMCSAAFPLSDTIFFGVQGSLGLMTSDAKTDVDGTIFVLPVTQHVNSNLHTQTNAYVFEAGAGFVKKLEGGQAGLLLRSGKLYSSKADAEFSSNFSTPDSKSTSNTLRYISGMSLAMGFYTRIMHQFGFAFETEYRFPVEYSNTTLDQDDGHIEERPYMMTLGNRFQFKSGIEWSGIQNFRLSAGILVSFEKKEKAAMFHVEGNDGPNVESENIRFIGLVCGGSYRVSDVYLATLTAGYVRASLEQEKGDRKILEALYERFIILAGMSMGF